MPTKEEARLRIEIEQGLLHCTGTIDYTKSAFGLLKWTDGVVWLAEKAGFFWFLDIIESYQPELRGAVSEFTGPGGIPFQIWGIKVHDDKSATVYMIEDSNLPPVIEQEIPYTDFVLPEFEMYCIDDVVLCCSPRVMMKAMMPVSFLV